jgi:oxygen-independent coproporphyrinogen-3 oxidase
MKMPMPLGIYVSVPFCRTKCSYCNFASDVFSRAVFERYVDRVCAEIERSRVTAESMGGDMEHEIDSIYLGGGTPSILDSHQLERIFVTIRQNFCLQTASEITVECAPGTLSEPILDALQRTGVNRVSLGVQSFIHRESAAVGRPEQRSTIVDDMARLRARDITNINIDLIAGLPHQTAESWESSLSQAIDSGAPHVSAYMLEIDEDSRLGRELMAGGTRYHAHFVPDEDLTADLYLTACERLNAAGIEQYEISNFACAGFESRHNLKYWLRQPYLGFGVDAHSMLRTSTDAYRLVNATGSAPPAGTQPCEISSSDLDAVRFSTAASLDWYLSGAPLFRTPVSRRGALEETLFLGLRLQRGVDWTRVAGEFGADAVARLSPALDEFIQGGLMIEDGKLVRLTARGRLLSNEIFQQFLTPADSVLEARTQGCEV